MHHEPAHRATANLEAVRRIRDARPVWVDAATAGEVIPGFQGMVLGHAGPPVTWEGMSVPQRGAAVASCLFEGWASSVEGAAELLASGAVRLVPNNDLGAVNPMAGIMSPSSAVFAVREEQTGLIAVSTFVEAMNPGHRFGDYSPATVARLHWLRGTLLPVLKAAVRDAGGIPLKPIARQAVLMGDELHQRNLAATVLLLKELIPHLARLDIPHATAVDVADYFGRGNIQFFLNLGMAMAKASMRPVESIAGSSVVTVMARNGNELGIKVAGLGDRWFTGPSGVVRGSYFEGFGPADAHADIGDSAIMETFGLGYHALPAALPALDLIGITDYAETHVLDAEVRRYCAGVNPEFSLPQLTEPGLPAGIDCVRVSETGVAPGIATAIAHRQPGVGMMIGAGLVRAPMKPFLEASEALGRVGTLA